MGYTHYYRKNLSTSVEQWDKFIKEVKTLKKEFTKDFELGGMNGNGKPLISKEVVAFNGKFPNHHEGFLIKRCDVFEHEFTKTNRKLYDAMVLATLISAYKNIEGFYFDSDGINKFNMFDSEFKNAVDFYNETIKPSEPFTTDEFISQLKYFKAS